MPTRIPPRSMPANATPLSPIPEPSRPGPPVRSRNETPSPVTSTPIGEPAGPRSNDGTPTSSGSTFEEVADWAPAELLELGVRGSGVADNAERCRRAEAIIAEYELYPEEFDEPPVLRLLIKHRGDMVAAADDPALVEHLRSWIGLDALLVQVWQDLERFCPHPAGLQGGSCTNLGDRLTEAVNEVRVRAGLRRLTRRQVGARRLMDVIREVNESRKPRTAQPDQSATLEP